MTTDLTRVQRHLSGAYIELHQALVKELEAFAVDLDGNLVTAVYIECRYSDVPDIIYHKKDLGSVRIGLGKRRHANVRGGGDMTKWMDRIESEIDPVVRAMWKNWRWTRYNADVLTLTQLYALIRQADGTKPKNTIKDYSF